MSGHSRWAGIKHKKGIADAKRGKLFTKTPKPQNPKTPKPQNPVYLK
jgi:hypothetical protein